MQTVIDIVSQTLALTLTFSCLSSSLKERQAQWQRDEEERIASIPDPEMPPGHRVLPASEQKDTLEKLKQSEYIYLHL